MPNTAGRFPVYYPAASAPLIPWQDHFEDLAQSVSDALTNTRVPVAVTNAADRDTKFPSPTNGDRVWRIDQAWEEVRISGSWQVVSGVTPYADAAIPAAAGISATAWITLALSTPSAAKGMTWASGNPGRLTASVAGRYRFQGAAIIAASAYGQARFRKNGSTTFAESSASVVAGNAYPNAWADVDLAVNDYVEFQIVTNSGGALAGGRISASYIRPIG